MNTLEMLWSKDVKSAVKFTRITGQNVQKLQILLIFASCIASILNLSQQVINTKTHTQKKGYRNGSLGAPFWKNGSPREPK